MMLIIRMINLFLGDYKLSELMAWRSVCRSSGVRLSGVNFSFKRLLLQNHSSDFNKNLAGSISREWGFSFVQIKGLALFNVQKS